MFSFCSSALNSSEPVEDVVRRRKGLSDKEGDDDNDDDDDDDDDDAIVGHLQFSVILFGSN